MSDDALDRIVAFLREARLEVVEGPLADDTFLPGIRVDAGRLLVDPARLEWSGDLLHEAGHLALVPAANRPATTGEVAVPGVPMGQVEPAAMLWSYAAALHLRLDPAVVFHAGGYRGRGPDLLRTFSYGVYPGLPVLAQLGLADTGFPRMLRWLAP
jgi:hypothetical protein